LGFFISAATGQAGIILVTNHTALGANDYVDWGSASLGQAPGSPPPTNSSIPNPYFFQSVGGISTRVSKRVGAGAFTFFIQGGVGQDFDHGGYWGRSVPEAEFECQQDRTTFEIDCLAECRHRGKLECQDLDCRA
jgi:hypothetical protein